MFIKITENQIESDGVNFQDGMRLLCSAVLQLMNRTVDFASTEQETLVLKQTVYDTANRGFSHILESFDPTQTQNEDMDINAVIALQDQIIQEALETIKEHNPKRYRALKREMQRKQSKGALPRKENN